MKTFSAYQTNISLLSEAAVSGQTSALKTYLKKKVKIKTTDSTRGGYHIRFPLKDNLKTFFKQLDIDVVDSDVSISSKFETYKLITRKKIGNIPQGTELHYVNNYIGATTSGGQLFNNKDLNPDNLNLAGVQTNQSGIIETVKTALSTRYDKEVIDQLVKLMVASKTKSKRVSIPKGVTFSTKDLAKVSADFGEILAAIWCQNALGFKEVFFPLASNEKLIDIYGIRLNTRFPISVKSGGGGKVTIQNIIDSIKSRAKTASMDHSSEASLVVFNLVNNNPMKPQMIKLHQFMQTDAIKKLGDIMGMDYKMIDIDNMTSFVNGKTNEELVELLAPFWSTLKMKLTDRILQGEDKLRLIISPLGESIWKILNADENIKKSLNNVARQVVLLQVNVDVKTKQIIFDSNHFKQAEFEFGWAGYAAGNKLGFKMKLRK